MAELTRLAGALAQVTQLLNQLQVPYMVIGGVANLVWGNPRTTQDVDITVSIPDTNLDQVIEVLGRNLRVLPSDPRTFLDETHVLPLAALGGVRIDLIHAWLPFEEAAIARAQAIILGGVPVRIATAEDLIVHKLASKRPRDAEDATGVLRRQRTSLDRAYLDPLVRSLSEALDEPGIWETYQQEIEPGY